MKVAIMTQPLGINYGGIMQAWALQQVVKRMGHEPITIDRQPDPKSAIYKLAAVSYRTAMKITGRRKEPISVGRHYREFFKNNMTFVNKNIVMSASLSSTEALAAYFAQEDFGAVIVGSDQTWRPSYSPNIYNFFLDFVKSKEVRRVAYASSFGVDHWEFTEDQTQKCARLAKLFDVITVRESSGIDMCKQYLGVEAVSVLDPTLLLRSEDYESFIGEEIFQSSESSGVYAYFLDSCPENIKLARRIAGELNETVIFNQRGGGILGHASNETDRAALLPVEDWLRGFARARAVVSDSFHGMVFSILFNKPFFIIKNNSRGAARFDSLAEILEIDNSVFLSPNQGWLPNIDARESIVEQSRLDFLRARSIDILNTALS